MQGIIIKWVKSMKVAATLLSLESSGLCTRRTMCKKNVRARQWQTERERNRYSVKRMREWVRKIQGQREIEREGNISQQNPQTVGANPVWVHEPSILSLVESCCAVFGYVQLNEFNTSPLGHSSSPKPTVFCPTPSFARLQLGLHLLFWPLVSRGHTSKGKPGSLALWGGLSGSGTLRATESFPPLARAQSHRTKGSRSD